jgi:two-component system sensor histidine kinase EvgS
VRLNLFIIFLLISFNNNADSLSLSHSEQQYIKNKKVLTLCADPNWEPLELITQDGSYTGVSADYIKILLSKVNLKLKVIVTRTWSETLEAFKENKCDIIPLIAKTPARIKYMSFTSPYFTMQNSLISRNNTDFVRSITTILDKRIGTIKGYASEEILKKKYPNVNFISVPSTKQGLLMISAGEIDYLCDFISSASYYINSLGLNNLRIVGLTEMKFPFSIATHKDQRILLNILQKGVASIPKTEVDKIVQKHTSLTIDKKKDYTFAIKILIAFVILIALVLIWNFTLRKAIVRKTMMLQQTESYNKLLFNSSNIGLALCDLEGKLLNVNQTYAEIIGYSIEESLKLTYWDVTPIEYEEQEQKQIKDLTEKGSYGPYEKEYIHKNKSRIPVRLNGQIVRLNERDLIWSTIEDITEQKKLENQLRGSNVTLEKLVEERTSELRMAKEVAVKASLAKSDFLSTMSHELRTPMNGIIGPVQMLNDFNNYNDEQEELIKIIESSTNIMHVIINDILDFSKIESGKLSLEKTKYNIKEVIENVTKLASSQAHEKNIIFEHSFDESLPKYLTGDPTRLSQILMNLLNNAVKFTSTGKVSLNIKELGHNEHGQLILQFVIKDTGIGIPQEEMYSLFKPFTQADSSTTRLFGGTGLGLSIVKRLVDLHEGTIDCNSQVNIGTTFTLTLPIDKYDVTNITSEEITPTMATYKKLKILIVEDNKINQTIIKKMVQKIGHEVSLASNGEEAVNLVQKNKFDLILMDWMMPVLDGLEATKRIRSMGAEYKRLPIIGVTANVYNEDRVQCMEAGMNGVLTKPISKNALKECLEKYY